MTHEPYAQTRSIQLAQGVIILKCLGLLLCIIFIYLPLSVLSFNLHPKLGLRMGSGWESLLGNWLDPWGMIERVLNGINVTSLGRNYGGAAL